MPVEQGNAQYLPARQPTIPYLRMPSCALLECSVLCPNQVLSLQTSKDPPQGLNKCSYILDELPSPSPSLSEFRWL